MVVCVWREDRRGEQAGAERRGKGMKGAQFVHHVVGKAVTQAGKYTSQADVHFNMKMVVATSRPSTQALIGCPK